MQASASPQIFSRIIRNTARFFNGRVVNAVLSLIYLTIASKALGLTALGNLILIFSTLSLLASLTNLDAWIPLQNFGGVFLSKRNFGDFFRLFAFAIRIDCLSSILGVTLGLVGIYVVGDILHEWPSDVQKYALLSVLFIPFFYTDFSYGTLRLFDHYTFLGFCASFGTAFRVLGAVIGYFLHLDIVYFLFVSVGAKAVIFLAESIFCLYVLKKKTHRAFHFRYLFSKTPPIKGIWQQMLGISADEVISSIFRQTVMIFIGKTLGSSDVAIYQVSSQVVIGLFSPVKILGHTMMNEFIHLRDQGFWSEIKQLIKRIYMLLMGFTAVVMLIVGFFGQYLSSWLLHAQVKHVTMLMMVLLLRTGLETFLLPIDPIMLMSSRALWVRMKSRIFVVLSYFIAFKFFVAWGLIGVATEGFLEYAAMLAVSFIVSYQFIQQQIHRNGTHP